MDKKILLLLFILLISVAFSCAPSPPDITAWYQREIIGQGYLVFIERGAADWLIGLELRSVETEEYETFVYHIGNNLMVASIEGNYSDVQEFRIGTWYALYRKVDGDTYLYLLAER